MTDKEKKINLLIVDDHQLIIEGLKTLLESEPAINIVAGVNSGQEALKVMQVSKTDVVLADVNMPEMSGIELTKTIRMKHPEVGIIGLTMHNDLSLINQMIGAGALGYVLKSAHISELCDAIYSVADNRKYLSEDVHDIILKGQSRKADFNSGRRTKSPAFSVREKQILDLVSRGCSVEEIASSLMIAKRTVETHRRNMFIKTRTKSLIGLIQFAINNNIIDGQQKIVE